MIKKHFYLTEEQTTFLDGLDGLTLSENVRRAIVLFIEKRKKTMVASSPSKSMRKGGKNG